MHHDENEPAPYEYQPHPYTALVTMVGMPFSMIAATAISLAALHGGNGGDVTLAWSVGLTMFFTLVGGMLLTSFRATGD